MFCNSFKKPVYRRIMLGLSVCLAVILAAAFCAAPGFAAESAPLSGVLKFFEISETGDYRALTRAQAEDGAFGTLCAMLPVNSDEEAVLTAAVYNSQGCLQRFETDQKKANAPFQTLSVQIDVGQDETVRFFTFSSLERMTPVSCAAETPVSAVYADNHSIVLTWPETAGAEKYRIRRDGTVIGESYRSRFCDNYLQTGVPYTYTVTPIINGAEGDSRSLITSAANTCIAVLGENSSYKNITFLDSGTNDGTDSYSENTVIGGRACRLAPAIPKNNPTRYGMMYFTAKRSMIPETARQVTFEVTYFDNGTNDLYIGYNAEDGTLAKKVKIAARQNSNTWKTASVSVTDAKLCAPAALQSSDFRIDGGANTYIASVSAEQTQFSGILPAYADFTNLQYPETGNLLNYSCPQAADSQAWSFQTNDAVMKNGDTDAVVTLEIDPALAKTLTLTYQTQNSGSQTVDMDTNGRSRHTVVLPNAVLADQTVRLSLSAAQGTGAGNNPEALRRITIGAVIPQYAEAILAGDNVEETGLFARLNSGGDSYNEPASIGGRACRTVPFHEETQKTGYMYFDIDNRYAMGEKDSDMTIEVDYFDMGTGSMTLQYNTLTAPYQGIVLAKLTDSRAWKTASVTLTNACMTDSQNYVSDFRITAPSTFYIGAVRAAVNQTHSIVRSAPQIFLASDSTCEPLPAVYAPREGWGMEIGNYFKETVQIINKAKGGKSSRTFLNGHDPTANPEIINDGRMEAILAAAQPGDYLFIQFGHNDRPTSRPSQKTDPDSLAQDETAYRYNLQRFIEIAHKNEMIPIFITSIHERNFAGNTDVLNEDGIEPYRQAMREVGAANGVPVLDVGAAHKELVERWGNEGSKALFLHFSKADYPSYPASLPDNTHISKTGAAETAKLVAAAIRDGAAENSTLRQLSIWLNPNVDLTPIAPGQP